VFGFDLQLLLAGFADPVMFAVNEGMVVDAFAIIVGAEIAFHKNAILSYLGLQFLGCISEHYEIDAAVHGSSFRSVV
jgi:hypothetical protein